MYGNFISESQSFISSPHITYISHPQKPAKIITAFQNHICVL